MLGGMGCGRKSRDEKEGIKSWDMLRRQWDVVVVGSKRARYSSDDDVEGEYEGGDCNGIDDDGYKSTMSVKDGHLFNRVLHEDVPYEKRPQGLDSAMYLLLESTCLHRGDSRANVPNSIVSHVCVWSRGSPRSHILHRHL